ncbi:MAG: N-acetyl-gamma-glutamyl-phosphate reductase [Ectothiorhodospiraceae bacterium]|nr:N-acetyl-gamma-glutamyl-phosphate reductase [Ectothiorhodospiraceae bacterium]
MAQVGIVGGTGYTGVELLRLLARHPNVDIKVITSRGNAGSRVDEMFPSLRGRLDIAFSEPDLEALADCDLVFFATPNGTAMQMVPELLEAGTRVVDLGADFRLKDLATWSEWYGMEHACPSQVEEAVYGLPELHREAIRGASMVANPGCYPTAVALGWLPLLEQGLIAPESLIADCKSGVSGAGRKAQVHTLLCEANENFKAYGASGHRHLPEIRQTLETVLGREATLVFVPHLVPMTRGMQATLYGRLVEQGVDLQRLYEQRYANEPFVDVLPPGSHPETRTVRGTNLCRVAVHQPQGGETVLVLSVIDNLSKGAASQAVQNMNLMLGLEEAAGLDDIAVLP